MCVYVCVCVCVCVCVFHNLLLTSSLLQSGKASVLVVHVNSLRLFAGSWTVACQAPLSMGFSRQEHWNGLPFPSPEDLPDPGTEPGSPTLQADSFLSEPPGKSGLVCSPMTGPVMCLSHLPLSGALSLP